MTIYLAGIMLETKTAADAHLEPLPVVRAGELERHDATRRWLVDRLWTQSAVGFIGGVPKLGKSWLGLDLALSVATRTPCLGVYEVADPGPTLVYLAEDHPSEVRLRIETLCRHRGLDLKKVPINVITSPSLRLDLDRDRRRLAEVVQRLKPKLLLLDPLVRLHRRNENDAAEVSELLAFLRELQRAFSVAVVVVHHMRKGSASDGQSLRGSGDFHAWTDSALYLRRVRGRISLHVEHRSAPSPGPIGIELVVDDLNQTVHLEARSELTSASEPHDEEPTSLPERITAALSKRSEPMSRTALRRLLRVNNANLGRALVELEEQGVIKRSGRGWSTVPRSAFRTPHPPAGTEQRNSK